MGFNWRVVYLSATTIVMVCLGLATMPCPTEANRSFSRGNFSVPRKVVVGGDHNWRFGFNYFEWALKTGPFFENDTLVFKYDPSNNQTFPHSVYQFNDFRSFMMCNLSRTQMVASPMQGRGSGFEVVLRRRMRPYLFACGERGGFHCKVGKMKFIVFPFPRPTTY